MDFKKRIKKWLNNLSRGDILITVVLVLGIIAVVNFLSYQIFFRADLTQNNIYSISSVSRRTAGNLDDIVKIKVYFSENLPNKYANLKQNVVDILKEYKNYSNGKVKIENINPQNLENTERRMRELGIPTIQFNVLENDSYQVVNGYMGISVEYGDNNEAIPVVKNTEDLEYKITTALKKVTQESIPTIGLVSSHGSLSSSQGLQPLYQKLSEVYKVKEIDLSSQEIGEEVKTLLLAGPTEKFNEEELKKIDKFVMDGGALIAWADGIKMNQGVIPEKNETNLNELLGGYGLKLNQDVVLDGQSQGRVSFTSGFMSFSTPYPGWVKIKEENFNQENPAVADLESALLPWPSSLEASSTPEREVQYLAKSSQYSWAAGESYNYQPSSNLKPTGETKQYNLAVLVSGKLESPFGEESTDSGKVVLLGDSDFINKEFLGQSGENLVLAQNLVDSVTLDSDLIKIRSKEVTDRSIEELSDSGRQTLKYLNIFGVAVLVVIFGILRYYLRKRRKS